MTQRALWFESHLLSDPAGRRARADCERLGEQAHRRILGEGDRLAAASPVVAQEFYKRAAAAWRAFGEAGFKRWVDLGGDLLALETGQRDAALAFFSVSARALATVGVDRLADWAAAAVEIAAESKRLSAVFLQSTAALVDKLEPDSLRAWVAQARRLYAGHDWRGEFLARAFLSSAPQALPILEVEDVAAWARLGIAVQPLLREEQFFAALPPGFSILKPAERATFFTMLHAVAAHDTKSAAAIYKHLPPVLKRVSAQTRGKLLEILRHAAPASASAVADVAPVAAALVHDLPRQHRQSALDLAVEVAHAFGRGAVPLLRSLPAAYEDARHEGVLEWVSRGLVIAQESAEAGEAYFALESRTSVKVLHASSTAATLQDVQGSLRKYVQMLSGKPVSIRSTDFVQLRSALEEFPLENEIVLPLKIDRFGTHEANCRLYQLLASQLAGRREYGTYDIDLPEEARGNLSEYLRAPEQPPLLEEIFLVTEGFRVAAHLARQYPGIAREQREVSRRILKGLDDAHQPSQSAFLDAVFAWLLAGATLGEAPLWMRTVAAVIAPSVAPLAAPAASANDSLTIARTLSEQLAARGRSAGDVPLEELAFERMAGEAMVEPYLMDDDMQPMPSSQPGAEPASAGAPQEETAEEISLELDEESEDSPGSTVGMSAEELQKLIESGVDLRIKQGYGNDLEGLGLYISDLVGKLPQEQLEELRQLLDDGSRNERARPRRWLEQRTQGAAFYYDEWDYHISDYRQRWCRLLEVPVDSDSGEFFNQTLSDYSALIPDVRRQFQRIRPEMYRVVRGLEDGEDFDLNEVVNARVDLRARLAPSSKLYTARQREERDVATLFLIDMSASTDEPLKPPPASAEEGGDAYDLSAFSSQPRRANRPPRRIIDVTKEALVIMAEALEEIGDAYAIYGFSGHGRANVEFYLVKSFNEALTGAVKGRIGALQPKRSTRMGAALRHSIEKMAGISARSRHMILLSDGFPQDFDYGQDRRSNVYGLRDTSVALKEAEAAGITPFCITVDKAGHDYLRQMCEESRYMVLDDIASLPSELPKVYQRVVTT
jgi:nitric oxide reductase activation protein